MEVGNREDSGLLEPDEVSEERKAALVGQILRGELTPQEACSSERLSEAELKGWVRAYTRAARRAIDNQVAVALAAHGLEVDDQPTTELSGNLGSVGLPELVQTIQFGRKDAHIRVDHDGEQSELWCEDGDIIDATSAQLTGSAAVYRILAIERGELHADFVHVDRPRTVHASTQALMLEAAKRADECAEIRSRLGDTLNIYVPSSSAPSELEIEPDQAAVLRAFDGERSIEDVVHQSELPDLETLTLVERLMDQEWLVLKPLQPIQRALRVQLQPAPVPSVVDASFRPMATSLATRLSWPDAKHRLWASALAGVAVVAGAFAIGFYSARTEQPPLGAVTAVEPTCGASRALLPGGMCIDRAEVNAGEYQACVRAGACEAVQREFEQAPAAPAAGGSVSPSPADRTAGAPGAPGAVASPTSGSPAPTVPASVHAEPVAPAPGVAAPPGAPVANVPAPGGKVTPDGLSGRPPGGGMPGSNETVTALPSGTPDAPAGAGALAPRGESTSQCNAGLPGRERHALNCVTFQQARRYCEWRGGRLPLRNEWEYAALPEQAALGVTELVGGLSEWAIEPATGATEATRERSVVLGGGLDTGAGVAGTLTRLYMNANAQGRSVGFRCVVRGDLSSAPSAAENREPASR